MIEPGVKKRVSIKRGWFIIWNPDDNSISMADGEDSFVYWDNGCNRTSIKGVKTFEQFTQIAHIIADTHGLKIKKHPTKKYVYKFVSK